MIAGIDDDEVRAMESRLRATGWTVPPPAFTKDRREAHQPVTRPTRPAHRPRKKRDAGFGALASAVKEAGIWLAENIDDAERPLRPFIASKFGLSFDDAGRAVAEAERLTGESL